MFKVLYPLGHIGKHILLSRPRCNGHSQFLVSQRLPLEASPWGLSRNKGRTTCRNLIWAAVTFDPLWRLGCKDASFTRVLDPFRISGLASCRHTTWHMMSVHHTCCPPAPGTSFQSQAWGPMAPWSRGGGNCPLEIASHCFQPWRWDTQSMCTLRADRNPKWKWI